MTKEAVNHPSHYNEHPSGVECIDIIEHMPFNVGTAIKHLWRAGLKENAPTDQDYAKALWYVQRERERLKRPTQTSADKRSADAVRGDNGAHLLLSAGVDGVLSGTSFEVAIIVTKSCALQRVEIPEEIAPFFEFTKFRIDRLNIVGRKARMPGTSIHLAPVFGVPLKEGSKIFIAGRNLCAKPKRNGRKIGPAAVPLNFRMDFYGLELGVERESESDAGKIRSTSPGRYKISYRDL